MSSHFHLPPVVTPLESRSQDYRIVHQKLTLDCGVEEQVIVASTELVVLPLTTKLQYIYLNCRHGITSITLDGQACRYESQLLPTAYPRAVSNASSSSTSHPAHYTIADVRSASSVEQQWMEESDLREQGELKIFVPENLQTPQKVTMMDTSEEQKEPATNAAASAASTSSSSAAAASSSSSSVPTSNEISTPFLLRITYTLNSSSACLQFLKATPYTPHRSSQLYTTSSFAHGGDPSTWMPCIDQLDERVTWELEILAGNEFTVLASGTLQSKTPMAASQKTRWIFTQDVPVPPRSIGFAIAPFVGESIVEDGMAGEEALLQYYSVPTKPIGLKLDTSDTVYATHTTRSTAALDSAVSSSSSSSASSAPIHPVVSLLRHTISTHLSNMLTLYENLFGGAPYPFGPMRVVCMDEVPSQCHFVNLILLDQELLYDASMIDQVYITTYKLAYAVALNWVCNSLLIESYGDWWIIQGISSWAAHSYLSSVFGLNDVKWRGLKQALYVLEEDGEQHPCYSHIDTEGVHNPVHRMYNAHPLYWPGLLTFDDVENPIMRGKAATVWRMLDHRLGGTATAPGQGLKNLVLKIMDEYTQSDEEDGSSSVSNRLSTIRLLEICIELSGQASGIASLMSTTATVSDILQSDHGEPLRAFFEQWVLCTGYPNVTVDFHYSTKKKMSVVQIEQGADRTTGPHGPLVKFSGPVKFRINEVDRVNDQERIMPAAMSSIPGATFTQVGAGRIEFEFICSSKVRRNRKRKKLDEASLAALALDKLLIRNNDTPILYCRVDPLASWFTPPRTRQADIHVLWKLLHERELVGQYDGIQSVVTAWREHTIELSHNVHTAASAARDASAGVSEEKLPDDIYPKSLWQTFCNEHAYVHIRLQAARALATSVDMSYQHIKYVFLLIDWFKQQHYDHYTSTMRSLTQGMNGSTDIMFDEDMMSSSSSSHPPQLRANSFLSIQDYLIKQQLPKLLCEVRIIPSDSSFPATPSEVTRFILGLLRENDNTDNPYSDVFYICSLLDALGTIHCPVDERDPMEGVLHSEVLRYLNYDQVVPSYQYIITQHALCAMAELEHTRWTISSQTGVPSLPLPPINYLQYAGPTHSRGVRLAAVRSLIRVLPTNPPATMVAIVDVIEKEAIPAVACRMLFDWSSAIIHGTCPGRCFRVNDSKEAIERITETMERLWRMINLHTSPRLRVHAYRLYRLAWGRGTPICASGAHRQVGPILESYFHGRSKEGHERTAHRIARASEYVTSLRAAREFPPLPEKGKGGNRRRTMH